MNLPFNITSPSCKLWLPPGPGYAYQGNPLPDQWLGSGGAGTANKGLVQQCTDNSGNANTVTQPTAASAPLLSQFGCIAETPEPALRFRSASSQFLPIPSSVKIGDGSPTSEATIIICLRALPGNDGFFWATGTQGFWPTAATSVGIFSGGANHSFPNPFTINTFAPQPIAIRFKSGETKLFGDTNYTDTIATNFLTGTVSGGFIGTLGGANFFADFDFYDLAIFDQALSDADVLTVMQGMKDRVAPTEGLYGQLLAFGDSRTAGYNSVAGNLITSRSWPGRAKRDLGGIGQWYSCAHAGDKIADQSTALTTFLTLLKPSIYSKRIVIGEVGVNDINAGSSAATVQSALTNLATQILTGGATTAIFLTIAPGAAETTRQSVNRLAQIRAQSPASPSSTTPPTQDSPSPPTPTPTACISYDPGYGVYAKNTAPP